MLTAFRDSMTDCLEALRTSAANPQIALRGDENSLASPSLRSTSRRPSDSAVPGRQSELQSLGSYASAGSGPGDLAPLIAEELRQAGISASGSSRP